MCVWNFLWAILLFNFRCATYSRWIDKSEWIPISIYRQQTFLMINNMKRTIRAELIDSLLKIHRIPICTWCKQVYQHLILSPPSNSININQPTMIISFQHRVLISIQLIRWFRHQHFPCQLRIQCFIIPIHWWDQVY